MINIIKIFSANRSGFNPTITLVYNSVQKYAKIVQKTLIPKFKLIK